MRHELTSPVCSDRISAWALRDASANGGIIFSQSQRCHEDKRCSTLAERNSN
jgi:hypothetical protein